MKTIIIGASGAIGYKLFETIKKKKIEVIGTYSKNKKFGLIKFDILTDQIKEKIRITKDDNVIILTAKVSPTWVYNNPKISKDINVIKTKKIIDDLQSVECKIFFMSSHEVFDGKNGNFDEKSKPRPLNIYGKQKLLIEKYLQKKIKKYCIIRTSSIVGIDPEQRCPVKLTYDSLLEKNARMAKDNFFSITSVEDLCKSICKILYNKKFKNINICHLSSKEKISRTKLAKYIIKFSKLGVKINYNAILFKYINYPEPRGRINNLISSNPLIKNFKFQKVQKVIKEKIKIIENKL